MCAAAFAAWTARLQTRLLDIYIKPSLCFCPYTLSTIHTHPFTCCCYRSYGASTPVPVCGSSYRRG